MSDSSGSPNSSSHDGSSSKSPPSPSSGSKSSSSPPPPSDSPSKSLPPDSDGSGSSLSSPPKSPPPNGSSSNNSPPPPKPDSSSPPPPSNNDAPPPSSSTAAASSSSSSSSPPPPSSQSSSSSSSSSTPPPSSSLSSSSASASASSSSGHPPPPRNDKHSSSPPNLSSRDSPPTPRDSPPTPSLNPGTTTDSSARSKQTPSTHPDNTPSSGGSQITPPSTRGDSSSSTPSSSRNSSGSSHNTAGLAVGLAVAGVAVILIAFIIIASRKKKRKRVDGLATYYMPPNNYSGRSDGYYYRQENPVGNASHSSSYYASQPPIPHASGIMNGGSQRGQVYHSGQMEPVGLKSWFSYEELLELTQGFSRDNLLGEGGFGCVYKGYLPDGKPVAVKQLKAGSGQGEREFQAEVEIISRVHHKHLVSLVGYCIAEHHRLLVYEFVPNNTLEHHLHGKGVPVLDWSKRVKIAIGSARGLAYLHEDCHPRIIHRDIKSANILLDDSFEAQVADFGLAKLSNDTHTHVSTRVMGTFGYMAPEYASSGKLTDRSDVFSFGVVLLELITGRKPVDAAQPLGDESLVEWARPHLVHAMETGQYDELVDPRLEKNYTRGEMFKMVEAAAACVRHSAPKRPRMVQVVRALDFDDDDLSNGVKLGQSQVFDSGQYTADIEKFRRMAFGSSQYSGEYGFSGEHERRSTVNSGEFHPKLPGQWTSNEWEPRTGSSRIEPQPPFRPPSRRQGDGESESETRALRYSRGFT